MTQDEIIEMAREVYGTTATEQEIRFANLVAAKEREALAQTQEPAATLAVRWHAPVGKVAYVLEVNLPLGIHKLYPTPPQLTWVGLTDEDRLRLWLKTEAEDVDRYAFAKAVEAALKELNA